MRFARVIVGLPLIKLFDYSIPENIVSIIKPGSIVLVPFSNRMLTGMVLDMADVSEEPLERIKPIAKLFEEFSFINKKQVQLIQWISDFYICGYGESARLLYPNGIEIKSYRWISLVSDPKNISCRKGSKKDKIIQLLRQQPLTFSDLTKRVNGSGISQVLKELQEANVIDIERKLHQPKVKPKVEIVYSLDNSKGMKVTDKQKSVLNFLKLGPAPFSTIEFHTKISRGVVETLVKKGLLQKKDREIFRNYQNHYIESDKKIILNPHQKRAISAVVSEIDKRKFKTFLLHGITGSGKTQVYIEVIRHVFEKGRGVICLIPEISLTPQTVARFRLNFGDKIAVLHSRLSDGERFDMWRRVGSGEINLVVGARSALFAPVQKLGLIIIDEEHEHTYKQNEGKPLYHARSAAAVRSKALSIPLLLGSATPSIESYYNSVEGKYEILSLPVRAAEDMHLPNVSIIDLRKTKNVGSADHVFSNLLLEKIENRLYAGEQVLLLQNRRGFSAFLQCTECGFVVECPHCSVSLAYHRKGNTLRCHYCDYEKPIPKSCPSCNSDSIANKGTGTQKVELFLNEIFPKARIERMDYDTTGKKQSHDKILKRLADHEIDILVGTQMIAKGLDFPLVTLVGVILADVGLYLPDFRASERSFHLLTQVAGRSGRGEIPGEVVIQTYNPDHQILKLVQEQNYNGFFRKEIRDRKALGYPPFKFLALIRIESKNEQDCIHSLNIVKSLIMEHGFSQSMEILGPAPAAFHKLKDYFRWQLLIKIDLKKDIKAVHIRSLLRLIYQQKEKLLKKNAKLTIDIDPHWLL